MWLWPPTSAAIRGCCLSSDARSSPRSERRSSLDRRQRHGLRDVPRPTFGLLGALPPEAAAQQRGHLAPEARTADAVEEEVDGVVHVHDQVDERPHQVSFVEAEPQRFLEDEVDGDGRRGEEEDDADGQQDDRHRRDLRLRRRRADVRARRARYLHDDRNVTDDEDGGGREREERQVDPRPLDLHERRIAAASGGRVDGFALAVVARPITEQAERDARRPEEMGVDGRDEDRRHQQTGHHQFAGEDQARLVRHEDGDETLRRHVDDDPRLVLHQGVREEGVRATGGVGVAAHVHRPLVVDPVSQQAGVEDGQVDEGQHGEVEARRAAVSQLLAQHHDGRQPVANSPDGEQHRRRVQPHTFRQHHVIAGRWDLEIVIVIVLVVVGAVRIVAAE